MAFTNNPSSRYLQELDLVVSDCPSPAESSNCQSTSPAWKTSLDNSTWTKDSPDLYFIDWSPNQTLFVEWEGAEEKNYWALILLLFPLFTIFGNLLVCLSVYREPNLRTVTNYFIVSLAVADIMVAILVMPLAVYVEVKVGVWDLGDTVCDTWVAFDVLCCTASILNLTAISVDRCMAVTQPLKYAKHKASKQRVVVTLALTWFVSVAISSPIALGMNYTERRVDTPWLCVFYNSDFIIYSSMGSFYIPCGLMITLYYRIFRSLKRRTRRSAALYRHVVTTVKTISGSMPAAGLVHDSSRSVPHLTTEGPHSYSITAQSRNARAVYGSDGTVPLPNDGTVHGSGRSVPLLATGTMLRSVDPVPLVTSVPRCSIEIRELDVGRERRDIYEGKEHRKEDDVSKSGTLEDIQELSKVGQVQLEWGRVKLQSEAGSSEPECSDAHREICLRKFEVNSEIGNAARGHQFAGLLPVNCSHFRSVKVGDPKPQRQTNDDTDQREPSSARQRSEETDVVWWKLTSPGEQDPSPPVQMESTSGAEEAARGNDDPGASKADRRTLRRRKWKKKEAAQLGRNSSRRERKVTKTLAVVLGVFLICWFPFFTTNIVNAVCLRHESTSSAASSFSSSSSTSTTTSSSSSSSSSAFSVGDCGVAPLLFSFFVWLGYINSFLNPIIYTILNADFRKAFKKILIHPNCGQP